MKDFVVESEEDTTEESDGSSDDDSIGSDDSRKPAKKKKALAKAAKKTPAVRRTRGNAEKCTCTAPSSRLSLKKKLTEFYFSCTVEEPPEELQPSEVKVENPTEWWMQIVPEGELNDLRHSGKMMLLFSLLEECDQIGDKLLVFSQSLYSLDVIEHFLAKIDDYTHKQKKKKSLNDDEDEEVDEEAQKLGSYTGSWSLGSDYFRLDGSTSIENRNAACNQFNRESNTRAR